jgi:hypothetical protein
LETTLRRIGETIGALIDALSSAWAEGAWRPEGWPPTMWVLMGALFVLLALLAMRRGRPRPLEVRPPQLLITQGEIVPDTVPDAPARRRRRGIDPSGSAAGDLTMTVSNLSRYPVQLLEVALREETRGAPRVAEVEAVVPAMGSVEVAVRVPLAIRGDGWIDLYCYAAAPRHKVHRHRAELVWEPWASRFKVAPMEQVAAPVRQLASEDRRARFDVVEPVGATVAVAAVPPADDAAAGAAPAPERGSVRGPDRAAARTVGGDRPTAVSRVASVTSPATEPPAEDDLAAPADATEAASLGALWDRLPEAGRPPSDAPAPEADVAGSLVPSRPANRVPNLGEKPARVASSSITPTVRPLDLGANELPTGSAAGTPPEPTPAQPASGPPQRTPAVGRATKTRPDVGAAAPTDLGRSRPSGSGNGHEDPPAAVAPVEPPAAATTRPPAARAEPRPASSPPAEPRLGRPRAPAPTPAPEPVPEPRAASAPGGRPAADPRPAVGQPTPHAPASAPPTGPAPADEPRRGAGPVPRAVELPRPEDEARRAAERSGPRALPPAEEAGAVPEADPATAPPPRAGPPAPRRRPRLEFPDDF